MSVNRVLLTGHLTRDAELAQTSGGTTVMRFTVAVNDRRKNRATGEWEDVPNFVDCSLFGNRASAIHRHMAKGTKVAVEGRLHYSSWEDRDTGKRRSKLDVTVDEIEFMSRKDDGGASGVDAVTSAYPGAEVNAYDGDDIPF